MLATAPTGATPHFQCPDSVVQPLQHTHFPRDPLRSMHALADEQLAVLQNRCFHLCATLMITAISLTRKNGWPLKEDQKCTTWGEALTGIRDKCVSMKDGKSGPTFWSNCSRYDWITLPVYVSFLIIFWLWTVSIIGLIPRFRYQFHNIQLHNRFYLSSLWIHWNVNYALHLHGLKH
jgi:hypothetical protein